VSRDGSFCLFTSVNQLGLNISNVYEWFGLDNAS